MKLLKNVLEFYGTIAIPIIYLIGLWQVIYGEKMNLPSGVQLIGLGAAVLGIGVWTMSYLHLGNSFGVLPRKQRRVNNGIYRLVKHPMYKGIMLTYLGLSMANQSYGGAWFSVFILLPLLYIRARLEDKQLS